MASQVFNFVDLSQTRALCIRSNRTLKASQVSSGNYNLKFIVGEEKTTIFAWHQVMTNASPVFAQMLQPGRFLEGQAISQDSVSEIALPEDDPIAMGILCNIFHLRAQLVPVQSIKLETLVELAVLLDKYDCAQAVQPWANIWLWQSPAMREMKMFEQQSTGPVSIPTASKTPTGLSFTMPASLDFQEMELDQVVMWILICSQLGFSTQFTALTSSLIGRASWKGFREGPVSVYFELLTESLQKRIENARLNGVRSFQEYCQNTVKELEKGDSCRLANVQSYKDEAFDCSSITLGNALLAMRDVCEGDWKNVENWTGSISDYHEKLKTFAKKLRGPQRLKHSSSFGYSFSTSDRDCYSFPQRVSAKIDGLYDAATKGLKLETHGLNIPI